MIISTTKERKKAPSYELNSVKVSVCWPFHFRSDGRSVAAACALSLPQSPSSCQQKTTTRSNHVRCMPGHLFNSFSSSSGGCMHWRWWWWWCVQKKRRQIPVRKASSRNCNSKAKKSVAWQCTIQDKYLISLRGGVPGASYCFIGGRRHGTVDLQRNIATRKWLNMFFLPFIIHPPRSSLYNIPTQKCLFLRK